MSRMTNLTRPVTRTVTVTVALTAVQGPDVDVPAGVKISVRAHPDNTGIIHVGDTAATSLSTSSSSNPLAADQGQSYQLQNMNQLWFDATVSGEKVLLTVEL